MMISFSKSLTSY